MSQTNYIDTKHHPKLKQLAETGASQAHITKELVKLGVKEISGKPLALHHVCRTMLAIGLRRKTRKSSRRKSELPSGGGVAIIQSKWDVLKAIETCNDIEPAAKKALLDLVWKELNK